MRNLSIDDMRNLLIDDMRNPGEGIIPTDCVVVRDYASAIYSLSLWEWDCVYLDHDLGDFYLGKEKTGYDILCDIEVGLTMKPKQIVLVTSNPVGRARMEQVIRKLYEKESE